MAAIKFPLSTEQVSGTQSDQDGWVEILDAKDEIICRCPDFGMAQAVYLSLHCAHAEVCSQKSVTALSGLGSFVDLTVKS